MWAAARGTATVSVTLRAGVAVISTWGLLDNAALQPFRAALDSGLGASRSVVIDLGQALAPSAVAVSLVGAMRRYVLARDATLVLVAVPSQLLAVLERAHVLPLYAVAPSVVDALRWVAEVPVDRGRRPG